MSQTDKIYNLLSDYRWHCTSEMYALFMADPRRRLCDLRDKGHRLENKKCELHNYHKGVSKMWRLAGAPRYRILKLEDGTIVSKKLIADPTVSLSA